MNPIRALLVDDEPLARKELRTLLAEFPHVEICGEAAHARQAQQAIGELRPDLVFLDVAMPGATGFDLLARLPAPRPEVIFTTAFDAFAVRAFEVDALDYLLKPVHPRRLRAALARFAATRRTPERDADARSADPAGSPPAEEPLAEDDRVFVRAGERCWFVPVRSIRLLEAEGNHTQVHFENEKPLLYRTLASMEARLPAKLFLRANRSQLVNLAFIAAVEPWFSGGLKATLRDGTAVEFSRRQAQLFRERTSL